MGLGFLPPISGFLGLWNISRKFIDGKSEQTDDACVGMHFK